MAGKEISWSLAAKLGSLAVHAEELLSDDGHYLDKEAIKSLLVDTEVQTFITDLRKDAMVPVKRK